jgi:hypothetical protein
MNTVSVVDVTPIDINNLMRRREEVRDRWIREFENNHQEFANEFKNWKWEHKWV